MSEHDDSLFHAALAVRREVMGAEYTDRVMSDLSEENQLFQRFITEGAWAQWTDETLSRRERSLVTLAILAVTGRADEFELHARGAVRNGLTRPELMALARHIGAYAGVPVAISARRGVASALADS